MSQSDGRKERKLSRQERDELRELGRSLQKKNDETSFSLGVIEKELANSVAGVTRMLTDRAALVRQEYTKTKKDVDAWLKVERTKLDKEYHRRFDDVRAKQQSELDAIEFDLNAAKEHLSLTASMESKKLEAELQAFTRENQAAQSVLRYEPLRYEPEPEPAVAVEEIPAKCVSADAIGADVEVPNVVSGFVSG